MGADLVLRTGYPGEIDTITIEWFDHNNVRKIVPLAISVLPQDKPRVLEISVAGEVIWSSKGKDDER